MQEHRDAGACVKRLETLQALRLSERPDRAAFRLSSTDHVEPVFDRKDLSAGPDDLKHRVRQRY